MAEPNLNSPQVPDETTRAPGRESLRSAFIIGLLAITVALVFYPVLRCGFVTYDDPDYVTDNVHVKSGLTATNIIWAFSAGHAANWHPLTWLSHMADAQLFGMNPAGHHATNALLHALNTILLFVLLKRMTGARGCSAFVAFLFALHPAHVESVAWIAERKDVLSTLFFFLTLLAYAVYAQRKEAPAGRGGQSKWLFPYALSLVMFAFGLMSKPMLVTVPFVLLLLDYWPLARLRAGTYVALILEKLPFFGLSVGSCVVTLVVQKEAEQGLDNFPMRARLGNVMVSYARYLGELFWPFNLATPYSGISRWPAGTVAGAVALLVIITLAVIWFARKFPVGFVGWFWFVGMMVPVIGLVQVGEQSMADRYTYLPYIGLFLVFAWSAAEICNRLRVPRVMVIGAAVVVCVLCGLRTRDQIGYWRNSEALYRHAIKVTSKNFIAYYNLGYCQDGEGRLDEAMTNYLKSIEIEPRYPDALNNIGCILAGRKQFAEAIPYFEAALKYKTNPTDVHANLANALRELGRFHDAIPHYRAVAAARPADTGALNGLGNALANQREFPAAIEAYEASVKAKPDQAAAYYNMANALMNLRRADEAISNYYSALKYEPGNPAALHDLGIVLAMRGNLDASVDLLRKAVAAQPTNAAFALSLGKALAAQGKAAEALESFREAARLAPGNPDVHNSLGSALGTVGRLDEAIAQFRESIQLRPASPSAHLNLGKALAAQGKIDDARAEFNEALRLKPDFGPAQRELQLLDARKSE